MNSATLLDNFDLLAEAPGGVPKLREMILQLAVRGRLVPQDAEDEPATVLLAELEAKRENLVKKGSIKDGRQLPAIRPDEVPYMLPKGWIWARLGNLAYPQAGYSFESQCFNDAGVGLPLIRIRDVGKPGSNTYYSGEYRKDFLVQKGDYVVSMDGDFRVAVWEGPEALLNQRVSRLIFFDPLMKNRLIADALQMQLRTLQGAKTYTTVDHLSGKQIADSLIPLPPLSEQKRIVAKVNELMTLCDALEAKLTRSRTDADTLAAAVVHDLVQRSSQNGK